MTSDATGRHDRATGDAPNGTPEGDTNATGARVLSITAAAQVLGLSVRTVQRRLDAGTLQAVEVEGARRVRLPDDATSNATDRATGGTPQGDTVTRQHATGDATEGDSLGDTRQAQVLAAPSREEELREEIRFLRGVVEQQQRDSAELRAALRENHKLPNTPPTQKLLSPNIIPHTYTKNNPKYTNLPLHTKFPILHLTINHPSTLSTPNPLYLKITPHTHIKT
jgi:excisionase family DNA binding protein